MEAVIDRMSPNQLWWLFRFCPRLFWLYTRCWAFVLIMVFSCLLSWFAFVSTLAYLFNNCTFFNRMLSRIGWPSDAVQRSGALGKGSSFVQGPSWRNWCRLHDGRPTAAALLALLLSRLVNDKQESVSGKWPLVWYFYARWIKNSPSAESEAWLFV